MMASDSVTETTYVVRGLQPSTSYVFLLRARNSHGLSLPSPITLAVKTLGRKHFINNNHYCIIIR